MRDYGATVEIDYRQVFPVTMNAAEPTRVAAEAAAAVAAKVVTDRRPLMGSEDFAYMLNAVPGCYVFAGNGEGASVHHPEYDFNDELLAHGASYWSTLVERELKRA